MAIKQLLTAACLLGSAFAVYEDHLVSRKLNKRFIDDAGNYNISFYHINDVHAHLDQYTSSGTDCTDPKKGCFGGYSRVKTILKETQPSHPDSLLLNVGDEFQGTMFFSFYGGEKIADTLNEIGFDAMTLGNHEFDRGDDYLGEFLENLTFPIVSANIVTDNKVLNRTIKPFHIFPEYELAIIGVTTDTTPSISSPGKNTIFNDPIVAVQNTVDLIRATTNITRIAAITHIGYDVDQRLAKETSGLYFIMGGHSHTPLGDFEGAAGPYPTIVENKDGDEVFIVTAYRWGEYFGYIDVTYDAQGKVLAYHGAPIHLTNATAQDEGLQKEIDEWRVPFEEYSKQEVGYSNVVLDQTTCQQKECLLGDFVSDAILQYRLNSTTPETAPDFALINAGGVRATMDEGPITRGEVLTSFPFSNAVVDVTISGDKLWNALEGVVAGVNVDNGKPVTSFLQVSRGIKIEYGPDSKSQSGKVLVSVTIGGKPLDKAADYKIATMDFVAGGGDNIFAPFEDLVILDTVDEVLVAHIGANTPVDIALDGRLSEVNKCKAGKAIARRARTRKMEKVSL
ncbi:Metallo-dependent phosphatase-like protein [Chaetomium sp. MPI-SDFR-AT-0129]|nr:Metallo-dependent phosphatase-like protein [Chaetomium sp. MPI-SDFR-AT-0129]